MKKLIAAVLSVILLLGSAAGAMAEQPVNLFYDAAMELLFEANNISLEGEAEFTLDGERFKTAKIRYVQDYDNSLLRLDLLTPRRDGTGRPDRESGYTVIANGENVYVIETFYPGVYKTGSTFSQSTILRKTVQMNLMTELVRVLAEQADTLLGEKAITVLPEDQGGKDLRIELDENVPDLVNTALNLFYQFVARRYFDTDYDHVSERDMEPMENYLTVTQGILNATKSLSLKKADLTLKRDHAGLLEAAKGDFSLNLNTGKDGIRQLNSTFYLNVFDRDGSHVEKFDPEKYGVVRSGGPEDPYASAAEDRSYFDEEEFDLLTEQARAFLGQSGYATESGYGGTVYQENNRIRYEFEGDGDEWHVCYFTDPEGKLLGLHHLNNIFQQVNADQYHFDAWPDEKLVSEASEKALQYLAEVNPEVRQLVDQISLEWWYEEDGELFFSFHEDPIAQDWDGFSIIVRVQPEWRIEIFSCTSNG